MSIESLPVEIVVLIVEMLPFSDQHRIITSSRNICDGVMISKPYSTLRKLLGDNISNSRNGPETLKVILSNIVQSNERDEEVVAMCLKSYTTWVKAVRPVSLQPYTTLRNKHYAYILSFDIPSRRMMKQIYINYLKVCQEYISALGSIDVVLEHSGRLSMTDKCFGSACQGLETIAFTTSHSSLFITTKRSHKAQKLYPDHVYSAVDKGNSTLIAKLKVDINVNSVPWLVSMS